MRVLQIMFVLVSVMVVIRILRLVIRNAQLPIQKAQAKADEFAVDQLRDVTNSAKINKENL